MYLSFLDVWREAGYHFEISSQRIAYGMVFTHSSLEKQFLTEAELQSLSQFYREIPFSQSLYRSLIKISDVFRFLQITFLLRTICRLCAKLVSRFVFCFLIKSIWTSAIFLHFAPSSSSERAACPGAITKKWTFKNETKIKQKKDYRSHQEIPRTVGCLSEMHKRTLFQKNSAPLKGLPFSSSYLTNIKN